MLCESSYSTHMWGTDGNVSLELQFSALLLPSFLQGSGRYSIYIANYANGRVGPHALIEMDTAASDLEHGIVALNDVAAEAGVNKFTGMREAEGCYFAEEDLRIQTGKTFDQNELQV